MNSIVIGTNGSAEARSAVVKGLDLAAEIDAQVTFVSVRDVMSMLRSDHHAGAEIVAIDDALAEAGRRGVTAEAESEEGDPTTEILRVARRTDADLIVIGSSGAAAAHRSVSHELPRHSEIPVLVIESGR